MKKTNTVLTIRTNAIFKKRIIDAALKAGVTMSGYVLTATSEKMAKDIEIALMEKKENK